MRILVIEDEPKLGDYLKKGLEENGYVVDIARDGIEGKYLATEGDYALILLDVMLPGIDGFAVLQAIRRTKNVPVLVLTARDKVEDRVQGLQQGADDYLVKPFSFEELLGRIRAILRRVASRASPLLQHADRGAGPQQVIGTGEADHAAAEDQNITARSIHTGYCSGARLLPRRPRIRG